jgi:hypothetical protein
METSGNTRATLALARYLDNRRMIELVRAAVRRRVAAPSAAACSRAEQVVGIGFARKSTAA